MVEDKSKPITIDLISADRDHVDPADLLNLLETRRHDIKEVRFNPPKLGDDSFGDFIVTWKHKNYNKIANV